MARINWKLNKCQGIAVYDCNFAFYTKSADIPLSSLLSLVKREFSLALVLSSGNQRFKIVTKTRFLTNTSVNQNSFRFVRFSS